MKSYRRAPNCGPVPYPDRSGRMLRDEVVTGPEWAGLVALGYVVEVNPSLVEKVAEPVAEPVAVETAAFPDPKGRGTVSDLMSAAVAAAGDTGSSEPVSLLDAAVAAQKEAAPEEVTDVAKTDERAGDSGVDSASAGVTSAEAPTNQRATRGRPRRS